MTSCHSRRRTCLRRCKWKKHICVVSEMCAHMLSSRSRCTPKSHTIDTGSTTSVSLFIVVSDWDKLFSAYDDLNHVVLWHWAWSRLEPHQSLASAMQCWRLYWDALYPHTGVCHRRSCDTVNGAQRNHRPHLKYTRWMALGLKTTHVACRDVTDSESPSESDGIRQFFRNPKSDGYLKSHRNGFKILVSDQIKCYFRK